MKQFENWYYKEDRQKRDDLTDEHIYRLEKNKKYYWRVRYRDQHLNWSDWSNISSFMTNKIMRTKYLIIFLLFSLLSCNKKGVKQKPNIVYILADDLGYGDLGVYGQKFIETPNIDKLAKDGMYFTNHYAGSPVCAPSRYTLITGKHTGNGTIRGNDEWKERGKVWDYEEMIKDSTLEGQRPMLDDEITIAQVLKKSGYKTAMFANGD